MSWDKELLFALQLRILALMSCNHVDQLDPLPFHAAWKQDSCCWREFEKAL
jgi:hypothetical protein